MIKNQRINAALGASFTIIELLVVVSILAILIGFALPSFLSSKDTAGRRKAVITAKNLELACNEYCNQLQEWPGSGAAKQDVDGNLLDKLIGNNSDNISFFEIGTNTVNTFTDPWGNPFQVKFDHDFDNKVTGPDGSTVISKSVIVWAEYTYTNRGQVITVTNKSWE